MSRWQGRASPIWSGQETDMGVTSRGDGVPVQTPGSDLNLEETGELETLTFLKPVLYNMASLVYLKKILTI